MGAANVTGPTSRVPLLVAREVGLSLVTDPCPFCGQRHWHGAAGGYGHRVAHCPDRRKVGRRWEDVPDHNGYILVPPARPQGV